MQYTYPGIYIEELPNPVKTIVGASTSVTAFIGKANKGPVDTVTRIYSFSEFENIFGKLSYDCPMGYSVYQYFLNGGAEAVIVRVVQDTAVTAQFDQTDSSGGHFVLDAKNPGDWVNDYHIEFKHKEDDLFDVYIGTLNEERTPPELNAVESILNVSMSEDHPRFVGDVLANESKIVSLNTDETTAKPSEGRVDATTAGDNGGEISQNQIIGNDGTNGKKKTGIYAFDDIRTINLVVVPPYTANNEIEETTYTDVLNYCEKRRAMLIVDPSKDWKSAQDVENHIANWVDSHENVIRVFPRIIAPDPIRKMQPREFPPSGAVAGIFARTDSKHGVWRAAAGVDATIRGISGLSVTLTDNEIGRLNPKGVNCFKTLPIIGPVVWGARTGKGADLLADQWKYSSVRRTALYIEQTLERQLQWTLFKGNGPRLWSQIRMAVGSFMHSLFRQGAFQGLKPSEAYFVKVDSETTTPDDIRKGIVNIIVAFKPLMVTEFVVIKIQQIVETEGGA